MNYELKPQTFGQVIGSGITLYFKSFLPLYAIAVIWSIMNYIPIAITFFANRVMIMRSAFQMQMVCRYLVFLFQVAPVDTNDLNDCSNRVHANTNLRIKGMIPIHRDFAYPILEFLCQENHFSVVTPSVDDGTIEDIYCSQRIEPFEAARNIGNLQIEDVPDRSSKNLTKEPAQRSLMDFERRPGQMP